MTLLQMSVSGAVMILVTAVVRAVFIRKLPKRTFTVLWCVVLVRLLVPYSLPSVFSVYSLLARSDAAGEAPEKTPADIPPPSMSGFLPGNTADTPDPAPAVPLIDPLTLIWAIGLLACAAFFSVYYLRCLRKFNEFLPVDNNECISQWLAEHRLFRRINVRRSDMISTPLTYGIFRPVILLPKKIAQDSSDDLKYVLSHEYVHIRRFDTVFKLVLTAALCVHWFNPLVWVMYVIANKDIEISCDEAVVRMFGEQKKADYALALIRMEEKKSGLAPLVPHYNKSPIEERIVTIMKYKKTTVFAAAAAVLLTLGTTVAFATSAQPQTDDPEPPASTVSEPIDSSEPADDPTSGDDTSAPSETSDTPEEDPSSSVDTPVLPSASDNSEDDPANYNDPRIPVGEPVTVEEMINKNGDPYKVYYIGWDEDDTEHKGSRATAMYADAIYVYRLKESDAPAQPVEEREYTHCVNDGEVIIYW